MQNRNRQAMLKIAAGAVIGLFLLDRLVLSPFFASWKGQGERIADLRQKVQRGQQLLDREKSLRERWAEMQRTDLQEDASAAEAEIFSERAKTAAALEAVAQAEASSPAPPD